MSHWNYRLMKNETPEETELVLTEVYYNDKGEPDGYIGAATFAGETPEEVFQALARAFDAYGAPVLTKADFTLPKMGLATVSDYATVAEIEAMK